MRLFRDRFPAKDNLFRRGVIAIDARFIGRYDCVAAVSRQVAN